MDAEKILVDTGLTSAEAKVYILLLQQGEMTASSIAQKSGANRTFTYDRIRKLIAMGLVSSVNKDSKQYFKAAPPTQLLSILKEKETEVRSMLPELEKMSPKDGIEPVVELFSSKKGIRTVLNLILKDKKKVYVHGSIKLFESTMGSYFDIWNKQRLDRNIEIIVLTNEPVSLLKAEIETLSEEAKANSTTFVFGNEVVVCYWSENPIAVRIVSEDIAREQVSLFKNIIGREVKLYSGVDGIVKAFYELIEDTAEYCGFGYSEKLAKVYGTKISDVWHDIRMKNGVSTRLISYSDKDSIDYFKTRMNQWKKFNVKFLDETISGPAC